LSLEEARATAGFYGPIDVAPVAVDASHGVITHMRGAFGSIVAESLATLD
jgi:hypothetical protein